MTTGVGFTNATEAEILNCYVGGTNITAPAACYLGIFSVAPDDAGAGGTELSGNGYARVSVRSKFATPAVAGSISNDAAIDFAAASGAWSAGVAVGLFAASSGGTPFAVAATALAALTLSGQYHHIPIAGVTFTMD